MKTKNVNKKCIVAWVLGLFLLNSFSLEAGYFETVFICPNWPGEYRDWNMGDELNNYGPNLYKVPFLEANINVIGNNPNVIPHGMNLEDHYDGIVYFYPPTGHFAFPYGLFGWTSNSSTQNYNSSLFTRPKTDETGCFPPLGLFKGDLVKITLFYSIKDTKGREVTFFSHNTGDFANEKELAIRENQNITSGIKNIDIEFKFDPDDYNPAIFRTIDLDVPIDADPHFSMRNIVPAAGTAIKNANRTGIPEDIKFSITKTTNETPDPRGNPVCDGSDRNYFRRRFLSDSSMQICLGSVVMDSKRTILHEMGHGLAFFENGPLGGDYNASKIAGAPNVYPSNMCRQNTGWTHKSREWVGRAASEGFADFFAAITYNSRNTAHPRFIFGPNNYFDTSFMGSVGGSVPLYASDHTGDYNQYIRNVCPPPDDFKHLGGATDWLFFFWGLWNSGQNIRYEVNEINKIWSDSKNDILKSSAIAYVPEYIKDIIIRDRDRARTKAFCVPYTTTGEDGWTCRNTPWSYPYRYVVATVTSIPTGSGAGYNVQTTLKTVLIPAVEYPTGQKWFALEEIARHHYEEDNEAKYENFERTAERAGVIYP